jgi:hypothetical protein
MGYEVELYIGERDEQFRHIDSVDYLRVIATVELCKPGYNSKIYSLSHNKDIGTPVFIYGSDGNTKITEDCYSKPLKSIPIADVIKAIKYDNKHELYRRFIIALELLQSIDENWKGDKYPPEVVLFGS